MGKTKTPPQPPPPTGPFIICAGCKKSFPLSKYQSIRKRLYKFGPDGFGVYESLPFCSIDCWNEHPTAMKRQIRDLWTRCHEGARSGEQCENPGAYTCEFVCCSCRKCEDHKTDSMVLVSEMVRRRLHNVG